MATTSRRSQTMVRWHDGHQAFPSLWTRRKKCFKIPIRDAEARPQLTPRPWTCLAYLDDNHLCGERATTVDPQQGIVVCPEYAS
jgi:hypothetical protein